MYTVGYYSFAVTNNIMKLEDKWMELEKAL